MERIIDPNDNTKTKRLRGAVSREPLLGPVFEGGRRVCDEPGLGVIRERVQDQLSHLDWSHKRFENPHIYPVGLSPNLNAVRDEMIARARAELNHNGSPP